MKPKSLRLLEEPSIQQPKRKPTTLKPVESSFDRRLNTVKQNVSEIPGQLAQGTGIGALGTYGDILDIVGLQSPETLPGEQEKRGREFDILSNMQQGKVPSIGELDELVDDDVLPRYSRTPNSPQIEQFLEEFGATEPKTPTGRFSRRAGRFVGSNLAFAGSSLKTPVAMAITGQALEEAGAPPWLQATGEILTGLKTSNVNKTISSGSPVINKQLDRLKSLGFDEKDLTLARNALEDRGYLKKAAKYTRQAEKQFKNTHENIKNNLNSIIEEGLPGLQTEGPVTFKKSAEELFNSLDDYAREIPIRKPYAFTKAANNAIEEMKRSLANSSAKNEAIKILEEAKNSALDSAKPGDFYTNFYKELNSVGNWGNPKQREVAFGTVKNAIKQTFKEQGPEGIKLANALENANKSWMKYLNAQEVSDILGKVSSEEGINFKKLSTALQKPDNFESFSKGIGENQAKNLLKISDIASEIGNLEKSMKGGFSKDLLNQGAIYGISKAILTGDLETLKAMVGIQVAGRLATNLLVNPSYQNIWLNMMRAAKNEKWSEVASLSKVLQSKAENSNQKRTDK